MDLKGRLVAGSHNRNEFVLINADEIGRVTSVKELSGQICQICGDEIEITVDGEPFVACNECAFPVCRPCYEYERREGNQACPQCKTRYKRIKGSPRVEGDEEEEEFDDLDHEFDFGANDPRDPQLIAEAVLAARLNTGRGLHAGLITSPEMEPSSLNPDIPLLTYGQEDTGISADKHALIIPPFMGRGKRVHPVPFTDSSMSLPPRPMDPKKDLAVYGYGTVAWKDRMEEWRKRQTDKLQMVRHEGDGGSNDGDEPDDPDLPKMDEGRQPLSRKLPISSSRINPYRMIILLRMVILGLFFHYRILHPVNDAYGLWLTSIICEIWFAVSWIFDQFPKWLPIERETYLDRLSLRYEKDGKPSELAAIDREYEEFKVRINGLVAMAQKVPEEGWTMQDGTPWPGNNVRDHPGMIQVFLGHNGVRDIEGNELPRLIYVSREKRPGFEHHKKAGAMNALIKFEKKFGQSPVFIASTLLEDGGVPPGATSASLLKEAIHVISCGYEDKSEWGKEISNYASIVFMALFISIAATSIIEMQWGGVTIDDWWRNEQFWVIGGVSSHFFALLQGLLKVLAGVSTNFTVTSKGGDDGEFSELYLFKWTSLLIPPTTLLIINIIGVIVGVSDAINNGYESWGPLFGRLFFALWVIVHLYPFLKGLMGKQDGVPTIIVVWSILLASIFSLLWVRINPFLSKGGIVLEVCGLDCD
ncbi:cellulose synthase A2 [Actinidia rufa]|uniref:Cellulose synthase n=1 Tax=Actinidia rufa TaxID=165716 RepID=A0A7J0EGP3_9ERIC|nr:cellulose synthase A2 [Actinidia rufa]